jgi:hypothetical protein
VRPVLNAATTSAVVRKRSRRCRLRKPIGRRGQLS